VAVIARASCGGPLRRRFDDPSTRYYRRSDRRRSANHSMAHWAFRASALPATVVAHLAGRHVYEGFTRRDCVGSTSVRREQCRSARPPSSWRARGTASALPPVSAGHV